MKVKMKTILMQPTGCSYPGDVINVSDEFGKDLIDAKAADLVKETLVAENKLSPAGENKSTPELEKLVADLEKTAVEAEKALADLLPEAGKKERKDAEKAAKAARKAADEAAAKLAEIKK